MLLYYSLLRVSTLNTQHSTRITFNVLKKIKSETDTSSVKLIRLKQRNNFFSLAKKSMEKSPIFVFRPDDDFVIRMFIHISFKKIFFLFRISFNHSRRQYSHLIPHISLPRNYELEHIFNVCLND